jgi:hypothetical protein
MQSIFFTWRIRDVRMQRGRKKKWRTLTWKMTEMQALAWASRHGFEIQRVEGSGEPGGLSIPGRPNFGFGGPQARAA